MKADKIVEELAHKDPIHWGRGWESEPSCFACESEYEVFDENDRLVDFIHDPDCLLVQARNLHGIESRVLDRPPIDVVGSEKLPELGAGLSDYEKEQMQRLVYKEIFPFARLLGLIFGAQVWYDRDQVTLYFQQIRYENDKLIVITTTLS